jgi:hypothetical protein
LAIDPTLRGRCTQDAILLSIIARLIDSIDELNDQNCFLVDQPVPLSLPGGRYGCTVCLGPGRFPSEFFGGAGSDTLVEDGSVIVTPLVVTPVDRPRRKWKKIADDDRDGATGAPSLLYFKHAILKALLGRDKETGEIWEPHTDEKPLLRDMLSPLSCDQPHDVAIGETVAAAMQIRFSTVFDWDIE